MDKSYTLLLSKVANDKYAMAKALAYFLFREVVEDIHAEGKISDDEMMQLNKTVLNRAAYLTDHVLVNPDMRNAFKIEAVECIGWNDPEMTEDLIKRDELYSGIAGELMSERLNKKKQTNNRTSP